MSAIQFQLRMQANENACFDFEIGTRANLTEAVAMLPMIASAVIAGTPVKVSSTRAIGCSIPALP